MILNFFTTDSSFSINTSLRLIKLIKNKKAAIFLGNVKRGLSKINKCLDLPEGLLSGGTHIELQSNQKALIDGKKHCLESEKPLIDDENHCLEGEEYKKLLFQRVEKAMIEKSIIFTNLLIMVH